MEALAQPLFSKCLPLLPALRAQAFSFCQPAASKGGPGHLGAWEPGLDFTQTYTFVQQDMKKAKLAMQQRLNQARDKRGIRKLSQVALLWAKGASKRKPSQG